MARGRKNFTIGLFIGVVLMLSYEMRGQKTTPSLSRMPPAQSAFVVAVADAANAWDRAPNELARASMRAARAAALCKTLPGLAASNWLGTVQKIQPDNFPDYSGKKTARIVIALAPDISLSTPAAPLLNLPETMVEEGTPVYAAAAAMRIGAPVEFSATFFPSVLDCMAETSLTETGAMTAPVFKIQLTQLAAAGD
jgi:hypothetical protein